jgi:hypothetical protein
LNFIKEQLEKGLSKEKITSDLLNNGWTVQDIEKGFKTLIVPTSPTSNITNAPIPPSYNSAPVKIKNHLSGKKRILLLLIIIMLAVGCPFLYKYFLSKINEKITDGEVSGLVSLLKKDNIQAAVVKKIYKPNNGSTWLIKSNGEKIFLYSEDLGTYTDSWTGTHENYANDLKSNGTGEYILPDQAQVYNTGSGEIYDISSYINGHIPDSSKNLIFTNNVIKQDSVLLPTIPVNSESSNKTDPHTGIQGTKDISPNGKYTFEEADGYHPNSGVIETVDQNGITHTIIQLPKNYYLKNWSLDSNYVLIWPYPSKELDVYDVSNNSVVNKFPLASIDHNDALDGSYFIYPSEMLLGGFYSVASKTLFDGLYSMDLNDPIQVKTKILPNEIKLVGLIP